MPTKIEDLDLRELADMEESERAFVSCYLCPPDDQSWLLRRAEVITDMLEDEPQAAEHFAAGMDLVKKWLDERTEPAQSVCVFACFALDFVRGYCLDVEMGNRLRIGPAPILRPLAELADSHENYVLIAANNSATEVHFVSADTIADSQRISGGIKNHVKKGGWSQKRYQRRRDNELLHYAKDVSERLRSLSEERDFGRIVLFGSQEARREILEHLDEDLREQVVADQAADLNADTNELLEEAAKIIAEDSKNAERTLWQRIKEETLADGLATTGAGDVWGALATGRVETLMIEKDVHIEGRKCRECENVVTKTTEHCPFCRESELFPIALVDEMIRQAERTSAAVEFAESVPGLTKSGGVAALLRY